MTTAESEYSRSKTSVWWDIENCEVPKGWDAHAIAQNVASALLNMNYCGPVSISAYGDTTLIPHAVQKALSSTGVGLNHVPAGVKDASDKKILVDMLLWAVDNPAPANFMLISGDRDFSNALHQLSMRRYTILLAQPPRASAPLVSAAKNVWLWTSLASGGPPLTSGISSRLVNNGHCLVSNYEALKDPVVSEQAQSIKSTGSTSVAGDTKDHKTRENHVPRGVPVLPQDTSSYMLQNGRGATGESVTSSDSFETFKAHHSDRRHTSQAPVLPSRKTQTSVKAKPVQDAKLLEPVICSVCQISCASEDAYAKHTYGKRHRNNLELQSGKSENMSRGPVGLPKEVMEKQKNKKKASEARTKPNGTYPCRLCNVICRSQICFDSHLRGQKHAAMLSQSEALIDSKKLQEKDVGEKDQPREEIVEPHLQSQNAEENSKCYEKHAAMVNQSEALVYSRKLEERGVREKVQPIETIAEPRSLSQNTQENTKFFEKPNEEFREICGISRSSVKEKFPSTKHWVETVFFGDLRCDFGAPEEARECIDGIVKPVNLSKGATEKENNLCDTSGTFCWTKQMHTTPAVVASDGAKSNVSTKPVIKEPEVLQLVWCQVCQITCNSKVAYANHTYGKKHRQKLELQSAKNENMSKEQDKLSKENAERMKKVLCKNQTAFDSQNHAAMVKEKTEKAFIDSRSTREELEQRALEHALIVDSRKIQAESDIKRETTEEHPLVNMDDQGFRGAQEDKEEVKEINHVSESVINAISENLSRAFTELNRESRIPEKSRVCLDVIPERVQLPEDVNVANKLEAEFKHKPQPKPREPEKKFAGLKEHPGEAAKREETKVQDDNFWTRLWGKKS